MRRSRFAVSILVPALWAAPWGAFAAGGNQMPDRSSGTASRLSDTISPQEQARAHYNVGVRSVEKADGLEADAARQADAKKQAKLRDKARAGYSAALKKFTRVTELQPRMFEAWNYVGYTNRKLGNYDLALAAYEKALSINPNYAEAIEYRGHAYLGLNRLGEAKEAYMTLFSGNRVLAAKLLSAMQEYIGTHRGAAGVDSAALDAFAAWVSERSTIASQTANLTRAGAASAWN